MTSTRNKPNPSDGRHPQTTPRVPAQRPEEATELGVMIRDSSTKVIDVLRRGPDVVDHEVSIAEASIVRNQKSDGGVQMIKLVIWRWVGRNQGIAIEHGALLDALHERLGECRPPDPQRAVEQDDPALLPCRCRPTLKLRGAAKRRPLERLMGQPWRLSCRRTAAPNSWRGRSAPGSPHGRQPSSDTRTQRTHSTSCAA